MRLIDADAFKKYADQPSIYDTTDLKAMIDEQPTVLNINKEKLIESLNEKISYLENENTTESNAKITELKELIYVINKGCFDVK